MKNLIIFISIFSIFIFSSCGEINDELDNLDLRLTELESNKIPSIEEQISDINDSIDILEESAIAVNDFVAILDTIQKEHGESIKSLSDAINNLKYVTLEEEINSLKTWVNGQIQQSENEAAALYATLVQYNNIKNRLTAIEAIIQTIDADLTNFDKWIADLNSLSSKLNLNIDMLDSKISLMEVRLSKVEKSIEDLLARIQSVTYIPAYSDGIARMKYIGNESQMNLDFYISPKTAISSLSQVWEKTLSIKAVSTETRAVSFEELPIVNFECNEENGTISIIVSGDNLDSKFFNGDSGISVSLVISDGNNSFASDFIPIVAEEAQNELWYTTTNKYALSLYQTAGFNANIISHTYSSIRGTIVFDKKINVIGEYAFYECHNLDKVYIPSGVTEIKEYAFYKTSLNSIYLPEGLMNIGDNSFYETSLTEIKIPNNVTFIGDSAFYGCVNMKNLTIGDSVNSIGDSAFYKCNSLTSITIPDNVSYIKSRAFAEYGNNLKVVTIGKNVSSIGDYCFLNSLADGSMIYSKSTDAPVLGEDVFNNRSYGYYDWDYSFPSNFRIYVPKGFIDTYNSQWRKNPAYDIDGSGYYIPFIMEYDFEA
ncbi:MAG: hypothetical protein E7137_07485 [Rikenellaceae bacterium]|nr:hypothetical protein [Rikenellaceae bacterium]